MIRAAHIGALLLGPLAAMATIDAFAQDDVTIYRCVDAKGQVSIGNLPCGDGQRQETRSMVRPVDGSPAPAAPAAPTPAADAGPDVRHVVVRPPQPLYECVRPDGSVYESDSGEGEARWVPLWAMGFPVGAGAHGGRPGTGRRGDIGSRGPTMATGSGLSAPPVSRISIPADPPRPDPGSVGTRPSHGGSDWSGGAGTWERDQCHVLPAAETCARLGDRREDIRRRFFNAQQRERDTLRVEERGLNARIDRDCRTY
jgi:hypothetical protein